MDLSTFDRKITVGMDTKDLVGSDPCRLELVRCVEMVVQVDHLNQVHGVWKGHWPALREFMQNTADHLHLLDGTTGRLDPALKLVVKKEEKGEPSMRMSLTDTLLILAH